MIKFCYHLQQMKWSVGILIIFMNTGLNYTLLINRSNQLLVIIINLQDFILMKICVFGMKNSCMNYLTTDKNLLNIMKKIYKKDFQNNGYRDLIQELFPIDLNILST